MTKHFDKLEVQDPEMRENNLFSRLPNLLQQVQSTSNSWADHLNGIDPTAINNREMLSSLPVLRKSDLFAQQEKTPPFGGFVMGDVADYSRVFMSPGPIWEPQGRQDDPWQSSRALFAAGFRKGDMVHNSFSYHMTPGGFILDTGARALGCAVFPAGVGNTEQQVEAAIRLRPSGYCGTADYLKVLLDCAAKEKKDISSIKKALVSGAALPSSLREELNLRGVETYQCYATADLGVISYETPALDGMVVNENIIVELVKPGTNQPLEPGEVGELVVTTFNPLYPLIRFGTGDLSASLSGVSACGRTNMRIAGWMGRADQRTKVKGMFVDPKQIDQIAQTHKELGRLRLVVFRENEQDHMVLKAEMPNRDESFKEAVEATFSGICNLRGRVEFVDPGSLPNDGKVISDERPIG